MISASSIAAAASAPFTGVSNKTRRAVQSKYLSVFTDIYQEDTNIVIWQRSLSEPLQKAISGFLEANPKFQLSITLAPQNALSTLSEAFGPANTPELSENIAELVDVFCCLFELKRAGLRLSALDRAMCPKFHVDNVPCRLITTYHGIATQWLPHHAVDRTKLGVGSKGLPDHRSGLFDNPVDIHQLSCGDVALLKGESWEGNEKAGLVHRSPAPPEGESRLLLTLDFING